MSKGLIKFTIKNFRGVVELEAQPNGHSVTLKGRNGAGKSAAIDSLWWGLGGSVDGEVVRNGADRAEVEIVIDGYAVRRQQARGKKPTLTVKSADGKQTFNSPTALLAGFVAAVERRTFSARPEKERAETLRKLAPGLDCSDLDGAKTAAYDERTIVNREAKTLRAQADGVNVPADVVVGEERAAVEEDIAEIAAKKADAATVKAANDKLREAAKIARRNAEQQRQIVGFAHDKVEAAKAALHAAEAELTGADNALCAAIDKADAAEKTAAALVDPDTTAIDAEIAAAKERNAAARREAEQHNRAVRQAAQQHAEHERAIAERLRITRQADAKDAESKRLTERLEQLDRERAARIAAAKLPIAGIALGPDGVTFDDGVHGPVGIDALNSASRIRLDVAIAAALGHRLIAIRDASLLDAAGRAEVERVAAERGVQLLSEIVSDTGDVVEAVIEEGATPAAEPQSDLFT